MGSVPWPVRCLFLVFVFVSTRCFFLSFRVDDFLFVYVLAYGSSSDISPFNSKWRAAASS